MSRCGWYLLIGGLVLSLFAFWFTQNYAIERQRVWVGMSGEARINWLLAARMLLTRMGARVLESSDLRHLDAFPENGTLLVATDHDDLDPPTLALLVNWIERGGHLIVGAQRGARSSPLLDELGIEVEADDNREKPKLSDPIELEDGTRLRVDLLPSPRLIDSESQASWKYSTHGGVRILEIPYEAGRVTVLSTLAPFANSQLGKLDHAAFLWHLAGSPGQPLQVWMIRHVDVPSLPSWLLHHAAAASLAAIVFIALVLWRMMARFGPIAPDAPSQRRSLTEQLSATGRFYASQRQLPRLIKLLREDCAELVHTRAPELRGTDATGWIEAVSHMSGLRTRDLRTAFTAAGSSPHEFTQAARILSAFRKRIAGLRNVRSPRGVIEPSTSGTAQEPRT